MSAWKLVIRVLADGPKHVQEVANALSMDKIGADHKLQHAVRVGMIERSPGRRGHWQLSQRGIDYTENRLTAQWVRPGGVRWIPTWVQSLPRDIRIEQRGQA